MLFDSPLVFEVWHGRTPIGSLDHFFVRTKQGKFVFILAGKWWEVEEVVHKEGIIFVKPFSNQPPPANWMTPRSQEISYPLAQQIKRLLLKDDFHPALKQSSSRELLTALRQRARVLGHTDAPLNIRSLSKQRYEVVTYAGDQVNLLLAALIGKRYGYDCDANDITHVSFIAKNRTENAKDFGQVLSHLFKQIVSDNLLADKSLLTELAEPFDDGDSSKWSGWIPPKYRRRFLADQIFDHTSALAWIRSLETITVTSSG